MLPGLKSGRALWLEDEEMDVEEGGTESSGEEGRVTQSRSSHSGREPAMKKAKSDKKDDEEDRTARQLLGREVDAIDRETERDVDPFPTQDFVVTDSDEEDNPATKPRVKDKQPSKPCRPGKPSPSKPSKPIEPTNSPESKPTPIAKSASLKKTPPRAHNKTSKATPDSKHTVASPTKSKPSPGPKHQLSTEPKRKVAQSPPTPEVKPKSSALTTSIPVKPRKRMQTKSESDLKASELLREMGSPPKKRKFWESRPAVHG